MQNEYCALGYEILLVRNAAVHLETGFENDGALWVVFGDLQKKSHQNSKRNNNNNNKFSQGRHFVLLLAPDTTITSYATARG